MTLPHMKDAAAWDHSRTLLPPQRAHTRTRPARATAAASSPLVIATVASIPSIVAVASVHVWLDNTTLVLILSVCSCLDLHSRDDFCEIVDHDIARLLEYAADGNRARCLHIVVVCCGNGLVVEWLVRVGGRLERSVRGEGPLGLGWGVSTMREGMIVYSPGCGPQGRGLLTIRLKPVVGMPQLVVWVVLEPNSRDWLPLGVVLGNALFVSFQTAFSGSLVVHPPCTPCR